jgi:hypothetical protein
VPAATLPAHPSKNWYTVLITVWGMNYSCFLFDVMDVLFDGAESALECGQFEFCGFMIQTLSFQDFFVNQIIKRVFNSKVRMDNFYNFLNHVVLINSFWGLDVPHLLPPNIVVTGPLIKF